MIGEKETQRAGSSVLNRKVTTVYNISVEWANMGRRQQLSCLILCLETLYRAILCQLEKVVKNIYPEGGMFAGTLGHMPFLLKDN